MKRTDNDLQKHLERASNCGKSYITIRQFYKNNWYILPSQTSCGSRFCEKCARKKRAVLIDKMRYFRDIKHCTKFEITFDSSAPDPFENPKFYSNVWDKLVKRLRRYNKNIKYFRFVELTKNGIPHFHVLTNIYIPHKLLSFHADKSGAGSYVWIRKVDPGRAINYIMKYITKATNTQLDHAVFFFKSGMRQVSYSQKIFVFCPRNKTFYVMRFDKINNFDNIDLEFRKNFLGWVDKLEQYDENAPPVYIQRQERNTSEQTQSEINPGVSRAKLFKNRFDTFAKENNNRYCLYM